MILKVACSILKNWKFQQFIFWFLSDNCWCGNSIKYPANFSATGCTTTCSGNSAEYCGGTAATNYGYYNVYSLSKLFKFLKKW